MKRQVSMLLVVAMLIGCFHPGIAAFAAGEEFYYDKYSVAEGVADWTPTQLVKRFTEEQAMFGEAVVPAYTGYSVVNGQFELEGPTSFEYSMPEEGLYELSEDGSTIFRYSVDFMDDIDFDTLETVATYEVEQTQVVTHKTLEQSGLVAPAGTYPVDGLHTDGFYYIKTGEVVRNVPTLEVSTTDNQKLNTGDTLTLSGTVNDLDVGDTITTFATIKNAQNAVVDGYSNLRISELTSTGLAQAFSLDVLLDTKFVAGTYTFELTVEDQTGRLASPIVKSFEVLVPPTAPELSMSSPASQSAVKNDVVAITGNIVDVNLDDSLSVVATLKNDSNEVVVGFENVEILASTANTGSPIPFTYNVTVNDDLTFGTYTVTVTGQDNTGRSVEKNIQFTVISATPELQITTVDGQTLGGNDILDITGTVKDIDTGDQVQVLLTVKDNGGNVVAGLNDKQIALITADETAQSYSHQIKMGKTFSDQTYAVSLKALDNHGKADTATISVTLETKKPSLTLEATTTGILKKDESFTFTGQVTDSDLEDNLAVSYKIVNENNQAVSGHGVQKLGNFTNGQTYSKNVTVNTNFLPGLYTVHVWADDDFGNQSVVKEYNFSVVEEKGDPLYNYTKYAMVDYYDTPQFRGPDDYAGFYTHKGKDYYTEILDLIVAEEGYYQTFNNHTNVLTKGGRDYSQQLTVSGLETVMPDGNGLYVYVSPSTSKITWTIKDVQNNRARKERATSGSALTGTVNQYPADGLHTDGFYYVRGSEVATNSAPAFVLYGSNGQTILTNQPFYVSGQVLDQDENDTVEIRYTIKKNGNPITGFIDVKLTDYLSNGQPRTIGNEQVMIPDQFEDGTYQIDVWAQSGQKKSSVNTRSFNVQSSLPRVELDLSNDFVVKRGDSIAVTGNFKGKDTKESVTITYDVVNGSGTFVGSHNDVTVRSVTSNMTNQAFNANVPVGPEFTVGSYKLKVRAENAAGTMKEVVLDFTVEAAKPVLTVSTAADQKYTVGQMISLAGTINDLDMSDAVEIRYTIKDAANSVVSGMNNQLLVAKTPSASVQVFAQDVEVTSAFASGSYTIEVKAIDSFGKETLPVTVPFSVGTSAPTVTMTSLGNVVLVQNSQIHTFSGSVTDQDAGDNVTVRYSLYDENGVVVAGHENQTITATTSTGAPVAFSKSMPNNLAYGKYNVKVWAEDNQGGTSDEFRHDFVITQSQPAQRYYYERTQEVNVYNEPAWRSADQRGGFYHHDYVDYYSEINGILGGPGYVLGYNSGSNQLYQVRQDYSQSLEGDGFVKVTPNGNAIKVRVDVTNSMISWYIKDVKNNQPSKQYINPVTLINVDGAYPNGGVIGGYRYVRQGAYYDSYNPVLGITTLDNQVVSSGQNLAITAQALDYNTGKSYSVEYAIKSIDGATNYKQGTLSTVGSSNGQIQTLNGSVSTSGLAVGEYQILVFAKDHENKLSSEAIRTFVVQ